MTESIEATVWHRDKLQDKVKCHVKYIDDLKEPQVRNRLQWFKLRYPEELRRDESQLRRFQFDQTLKSRM